MNNLSLVAKADAIIAKREAKKTEPLEEAIIERFKSEVKNFPVAMELLSSMYGLHTIFPEEDFIDQILKENQEGVKFYEHDIGFESANLMQNETTASRDGGAIMETMYCAWAIKFGDIYGYDIYFVPYNETQAGFACIVINPNLNDEDDQWKNFFSRDIGKKFAINMIVEYKTRYD